MDYRQLIFVMLQAMADMKKPAELISINMTGGIRLFQLVPTQLTITCSIIGVQFDLYAFCMDGSTT